jgi:hypothetical protein
MTSGKRGPLDQYFTRTAAPSSKKAKATAADGATVRQQGFVGLLQHHDPYRVLNAYYYTSLTPLINI